MDCEEEVAPKRRRKKGGAVSEGHRGRHRLDRAGRKRQMGGPGMPMPPGAGGAPGMPPQGAPPTPQQLQQLQQLMAARQAQAAGQPGMPPGQKRGGRTPNFHPGGEKGKLHREMGIPEGEKIPADRLSAAAHSKNPEIRRDAIRAETMKKWHHVGRKKD